MITLVTRGLKLLESTLFFYVSLTVHLSKTLANDQIDAQIFLNTFITILYTYTCFEQYLAHLLEVKYNLTSRRWASYCSRHVHVEDCNILQKLCIKLVIG